MKIFSTIVILNFLIIGLHGQSTYSLFLEDSNCKLPFKACESSDNRVNVIIAEKTGTDYSPQELIRGYMIIFDSIGDTIIKNYNFGDTIFSFDCIAEIENGFIVAGIFKFPEDSIYGLLISKLDINRDIVWTKFIRNETFKRYYIEDIFSVNNEFILCGAAFAVQANYGKPYLIKLDEYGNIINETLYSYGCSNSLRYMLTQDSDNIWMLTSGGLAPVNGPSISVYDLDLNFIKIEPFFNGFLLSLSCKWYSPNSFLISSHGELPELGINRDNILIYEIDTLYNMLQANNFGSIDTAEVASMMSQSIDFENQDSIFFAGYKNNTISIPWPGEVDWIVIGQVDSTLQPRFVNYIGGDAYYETNYILATKDGGVFICAGKFSHEKQLYDLLFLKLNNQGVLVNNKTTGLKIFNSMVWPNPTSDVLNIRFGKAAEKFEIIDAKGNIIESIIVKDNWISSDISFLKKGIYFIQVFYKEGKIETHKIIKI